jgi:hypothetical protein
MAVFRDEPGTRGGGMPNGFAGRPRRPPTIERPCDRMKRGEKQAHSTARHRPIAPGGTIYFLVQTYRRCFAKRE